MLWHLRSFQSRSISPALIDRPERNLNSGRHTPQKGNSLGMEKTSGATGGSDYTHRSATIGGTEKRYRPDHRDDRLEMTKAP